MCACADDNTSSSSSVVEIDNVATTVAGVRVYAIGVTRTNGREKR